MEGLQINFTLIVQAIVFIAAIFILTEWIFKPIVQVIQGRQARVKGFNAEAHSLAREVEQLEQDYEQRMQEARKKAGEIHEELRREALAIREQMLEQARNETQQYMEKIKEGIAVQTKEARSALVIEVERISREMARKILGREAA